MRYDEARRRNTLPVYVFGLADTEAVAYQACAGFIAGEPQAVMQKRHQHRQVDLFAQRPGALDYRRGIDFAVGRQVDGNPLAVIEQGVREQLPAEGVGALAAFVMTEGPAPGAQFSALLWAVAHGVVSRLQLAFARAAWHGDIAKKGTFRTYRRDYCP